jgi:putative membrane protein
VFAVLAGLVHVAIFAMESLLFRKPAVRRTFGGRSGVPPEVDTWAFNQGFYNLFLAGGAFLGVALGSRTLTLYTCGFMVAAAVVLLVSQRRLWRGAVLQGGPPLVALVLAAF